MSDPTASRGPVRPIPPSSLTAPGTPSTVTTSPTIHTAAPCTDKVLCERCSAEMYRMHAVWRCSACGYKTDCCGW